MKKYSFLVFALVALALFSMPVLAANNITRTESILVGGKVMTFTFTADSAEVDTSGSFEEGLYDGASWYSLPFAYEAYRNVTPATVDTANVALYLDGSYDGTNWTRIDTVYSFADSTVSDGRAYGTIDFMNKKMPQYRIIGAELAGEGSDTTCVLIFRLFHYQAF